MCGHLFPWPARFPPRDVQRPDHGAGVPDVGGDRQDLPVAEPGIGGAAGGTFALRAMMSLMLHWEMEGGHRSGRKKEETPAGEAEEKRMTYKVSLFFSVLGCVKRKNRAPALDSFAQRGYTRAIESKGADGSDSASAFCVFRWILLGRNRGPPEQGSRAHSVRGAHYKPGR